MAGTWRLFNLPHFRHPPINSNSQTVHFLSTTPSYVGTLDQGTSSTRFILYNSNGSIIASHQKEHKQYYPKPGWVEHDADEIYSNA
jgi:hypothetical protein